MSDFDQATLWYKRYLDHTTQVSEMTEVQRLIDICEQAAAQQTLAHKQSDETKVLAQTPVQPLSVPAPSVTPVSSALIPPSDSGKNEKKWSPKFWGPLGLGLGSLALLGVGGGLVGSANADHDRLSASCAPMCDPALIEGPQARASGGIALLAIGGAAAAADVVWWILTAVRKDREAPSHVFILVPTGTGISASGSF
ncbi:hypothetical protein EXS71_03355 [Candidatus Uhrbacteria bacterium]|nr:hypothetical protein [Candidatus Uhrbacteria bacterium]